MNIQKLIDEMTLPQKIAQLIQLNAILLNTSEGTAITGPKAKLNLTEETLKGCGSTLNFSGAQSVIDIQTEHLKNDPHKIPMLFMMDVIHGYKTIYPIPLALGASFEPKLIEDCAHMSAVEASAGGVMVNFSPMLDLVRDARWGRVMESTGEDPYLNSIYGKAFVKGYQGDMTDPEDMVACIKHLASYGAAEAGRDYNTVDMSEHNLREYFLPAYKAALDAGAKMVMPSFNLINGIPSIGNRWLLKDLLQDEWDFDGIVISDYAAIKEMITHGFAENERHAAELAINAGCDIEMMSGAYCGYLETLVKEGRIRMSQIDKAVYKVLKLKDELGLFENPYRSADPDKENEICLCPEHRALARKAAVKSAVLLKNNGVLPLSKDIKNLALVGPFAATNGIKGFWSCGGKDEDCVSVLDGVSAKVPNCRIQTAPGCGYGLEETDESGIAEAVALAKQADAVLLCIGEYQNYSGEGNSRADISLPAVQMKLAREVLAVNPNTAVVLFTGRPLAIPELDELAPAILNLWQPGTEGGNAAADLLFADEIPAGKLTMSFPYTTGQCPIYYNHFNTGRPLKKDYHTAAYTSRYQDAPNEPLYPFGYGLSYTSFEYGEMKLSADALKQGESITASVTVKNIGAYEADEVVQFYIRDCVAGLVRPVKELKGYQKIHLRPNEQTEVTFTITEPMLRFWNKDMNFASEPGRFEAMIGSDSKTVQTRSFELLPLRILCIGNSFTYCNEMPKTLESLCIGAGLPVRVDQITFGGHYFHQYSDSAVNKGGIVDQKLRETAWDYVILQEQSSNPALQYEDFHEHGKRLIDAVRKIGATPILYQTWSYKEGSEKLNSTGLSYVEMKDKLAEAYNRLGAETGVAVAPVGTAFFDKANQAELYSKDCYHPSPAGSQLAAEVLLKTLLEQEALKK